MFTRNKKLVFLSVIFGVLISTFAILFLQAQAIADPNIPFLVIDWLGAPIWIFAWMMATIVFTFLIFLILSVIGIMKK